MHGKGPEYLAEYLPIYIPSRPLRSSSHNKLCIPKCKYAETEKRAFDVHGPYEWNKLPASLGTIKLRLNHSRQLMKTHLFRGAFK